jgi:hypothetical protein
MAQQNKPGGAILVTSGGKTTIVEANFTRPSDTTAYAAGDQVCNSTTAPTIMTFSGCTSFEGGGGVIHAAALIDSVDAATGPEFDLLLFDTTATMANDNAACAVTDAEMLTFIGCISFLAADQKSVGANAVTQNRAVGLPFKCVANSTNLYGMLVARNAYTPASAEVFKVRLSILQD